MSIATDRYNSVAIALHWAVACLMIGMLAIGLLMEDFPDAWKPTTYTLHKSIGITVLGLSVFRLIWRIMNPPPALPATMKPRDKALAHIAHGGLYFLILAMPLTGWLMVSASAKYPTIFFWLVEIPFLPMPAGIDTKAARDFFGESHELLAYGAIALILLHIAAAIYHRRVLKDGVFARMLPARGK